MRENPELVQSIVDFMNNGHTKTEAARQFGVSRHSISRWTDADFANRCDTNRRKCAVKRWRSGGKERIRVKYANNLRYREQRKAQSARSRVRRRWKLALYSSKRSAKKYGYAQCGATPEQLQSAYISQHEACKICNRSEHDLGKLLHVDHDHITGVFRGLLCDTCNRGLGLFGDNPVQTAIRLAIYSGQAEIIGHTLLDHQNENFV